MENVKRVDIYFRLVNCVQILVVYLKKQMLESELYS